MSTATKRRPTETLHRALREALGVDVPEYVSARWVAETFGLDPTTVLHAIQTGKLPTRRTRVEGRVMKNAVRPGDALLVWGHRLFTAPAAEKTVNQP